VSGPVKAGSKVRIKNKDGEVHTVTAKNSKAFDTSAPGRSTTSMQVPAKPGTYRIFCKFHDMEAKLVVK
jgi:plastocyanin